MGTFSQSEGYNAAHDGLASVEKARRTVDKLMLSFLGWDTSTDSRSGTIIVNGGTLGNRKAVNFHLRTARLAPIFFDELRSVDFSLASKVPIPESLRQYLNFTMPKPHEGGFYTPRRITTFNDLNPEWVKGCPQHVLYDCMEAVYDAVEDQNPDSPEVTAGSIQRFVSKMNQAVRDPEAFGQSTTVYKPPNLHYTLLAAESGAIRQEKEVYVPLNKDSMVDWATLKGQIEADVRESRQVIFFTAAGYTSFGSFDDFKLLHDWKVEFQSKYGRSFTVHVDGAWGWRFRALILNTDGSVIPYEQLSSKLYFRGKEGLKRYNNLLYFPKVADSISTDGHKDKSGYSAGGLVIRNLHALAAAAFAESPPYLKFTPGVRRPSQDSIRDLCSHEPTASWYMQHVIEGFTSGEMRRRLDLVVDRAECIRSDLSKETFVTGDGRTVHVHNVGGHASGILNFVLVRDDQSVVAGSFYENLDLRPLSSLTNHVINAFGGGKETDHLRRGFRVSSTKGTVGTMTHKVVGEDETHFIPGPQYPVLRIVLVDPGQLSKEVFSVQPDLGTISEYDLFVHELRTVISNYKAAPLIPLTPALGSSFRASAIFTSFVPKIQASVYGHHANPEGLFFGDWEWLLRELSGIPSKEFFDTAKEGVRVFMLDSAREPIEPLDLLSRKVRGSLWDKIKDQAPIKRLGSLLPLPEISFATLDPLIALAVDAYWAVGEKAGARDLHEKWKAAKSQVLGYVQLRQQLVSKKENGEKPTRGELARLRQYRIMAGSWLLTGVS